MLGVMNRSEDDSLDQAKGSLGPGKDGYLFKLNRARVEGGVARAEATTVYAPQDFTFRQLDELLRFADEAKPTPARRHGSAANGHAPRPALRARRPRPRRGRGGPRSGSRGPRPANGPVHVQRRASTT